MFFPFASGRKLVLAFFACCFHGRSRGSASVAEFVKNSVSKMSKANAANGVAGCTQGIVRAVALTACFECGNKTAADSAVLLFPSQNDSFMWFRSSYNQTNYVRPPCCKLSRAAVGLRITKHCTSVKGPTQYLPSSRVCETCRKPCVNVSSFNGRRSRRRPRTLSLT